MGEIKKSNWVAKWCVCLFFIFSTTYSAGTQELVTVELSSNLSRSTIQTLLNAFGINVTAKYGVNSFRVTYTTLGSDMQLDTASGLLMLPDEITGPLPMVSFQHGTTSGRSDVPSNLQGGYQLGAIFATQGMIVTGADFIGLGTSRGFHPYINAETEASAAVDLLIVALQYMEDNGLERDDELFVTGYSQGGHAAMAAHRLLQSEYADIFPVTAALPMSGPYDVSGVMRDLIFQDEEYYYPSFLVYATLGAKAIDDDLYDDISDLFRPEFIPVIRAFEASGEDLDLLNLRILEILENDFGGSVPKLLFKDSLLNILENDLTHPLNLYLAENDVYDWVPDAPVRMLYCEGDDQVPFLNSILTDSIMNANGAPDVSSVEVSGGVVRTHTACIAPALNYGIPWLLNFLDTSPVFDLGPKFSITLYPNPAHSYIHIRSGDGQIDRVRIYNLQGQLVLAQETFSREIDINVSNLTSGVYIVSLITAEGINSQKIMVSN